jgi:hypothetical protein
MALNFFEMRWPVTDQDMTRSELMEEAYEDILEELPKFGLLPMSSPVYTWYPGHRGDGTWLVARLAVTDTLIPAAGIPA